MPREAEQPKELKEFIGNLKLIKLLDAVGCNCLSDFQRWDLRDVFKLKQCSWDEYFALKKAQERASCLQLVSVNTPRRESDAKASKVSLEPDTTAKSARMDQLSLDFEHMVKNEGCGTGSVAEIVQPTICEITVLPKASSCRDSQVWESITADTCPLTSDMDPNRCVETRTDFAPDVPQVSTEYNPYVDHSEGRDIEENQAEKSTELQLMHKKRDGQWYDFPEWAKALLLVGQESGKISTNAGGHLCIALSSPTRTLASALILTGIITSMARAHIAANIESHFRRLLQLKPNTPLRMLSNASWITGRYLGLDETQSEPRLIVRVPRSRGAIEKRYVDKSHCLSLEVTDRTLGRRKRKICQNPSFAELMLRGANLEEFSLRSSLYCAVICDGGSLRHDLLNVPCRAILGEHIGEGAFQDVVRAREFMSEGHVFHSSVLSSRSEKVHSLVNAGKNPLILFDGAYAFMKWHELFLESNIIVVLDRADSHFEEARNTILAEYAQRKEQSDFTLETPLPFGCEYLAYWR